MNYELSAKNFVNEELLDILMNLGHKVHYAPVRVQMKDGTFIVYHKPFLDPIECMDAVSKYVKGDYL